MANGQVAAAAAATGGDGNGVEPANAGRVSGEADDKGKCKAKGGVDTVGGSGGRSADSAGGGGNSGSGDAPPAKKPKKKYIRNPETHKVYRERMERELAQARVRHHY